MKDVFKIKVNIKNIIIWCWIFFILFFVWYAAYYNLNWLLNNSDSWWFYNDEWKFWWNYTFQSDDPELLNNWEVVAILRWQISSSLYWSFYFWSNSIPSISFRKSADANPCDWNTRYLIQWKVKSPYFWEMTFSTGSFYCPGSDSWLWVLYSDLLWYKYIWNLIKLPLLKNIWTDEIVLTENNKNNSSPLVWASFNKEDKLLVRWIIWKNRDDEVQISWDQVNTSNENIQKSIILGVDIYKAKLDLTVNKNIEFLTKQIKSINERYSINNSDLDTGVTANWSNIGINSFLATNKELYYFNYEGKENFSPSNENNKWKIVEIRKWSYDSDDFSKYQVGVNWQKGLIVKGWNIYINSDIYNEDDSTSLLVLIAKRDVTNKQNWWNIYINPNVTNIDAVLIAEWSIINFNWTEVITDKNKLRNQLYIYGSMYTKNSIWGENPYWSDGYINNPDNLMLNSEKYDLDQLRYFDLIPSWSEGSWESWNYCLSDDNYLVPRNNSVDMRPQRYAWAWKRECFNQVIANKVNPVSYKLRWTDRFNPLIVESNPMIKLNPSKLLIEN